MTTYTPSQLPSVKWKPCEWCDGDKVVYVAVDKTIIDEVKQVCQHCSGTGKEPVEMENPKILCIYCHIWTQEFRNKNHCQVCFENTGYTYKHQVGVEFSMWKCYCKINENQNCKCSENKMKFLPICQKVEGDNSVLMVVPYG